MKSKIILLLLFVLLFSGCMTTYSALDKKDSPSEGKAYLACYIPRNGNYSFYLYDLDNETTIEVELNNRDKDIQLVEIPPGNYALKRFYNDGYQSSTTYIPPVELMRLYIFQENEIIFFGKWGAPPANRSVSLASMFNMGRSSYEIEYDFDQAKRDLQERYNLDLKRMRVRSLAEFN